MKGSGEIAPHTQRIKPPYSSEVALILSGQVEAGLKQLKKIGGKNPWINYEDICTEAVKSIPLLAYAEWHHYWDFWYIKFRSELSHRKRGVVFKILINDLIEKGFLKSEIPGLTADTSSTISLLLEKRIERSD